MKHNFIPKPKVKLVSPSILSFALRKNLLHIDLDCVWEHFFFIVHMLFYKVHASLFEKT
jgi:hypothetical protein